MTATVLFSIPWELHWPGGVNQVLQNLLQLARQGGRIQVLLLVPDYDMREPSVALSDDGTETIRIRIVSVWNSARPWRHLTALLRLPGNLRRLRALLRELRPNTINVHYPDLWCLTLLWALRRACPDARFVLSFHGADLTSLERADVPARWWWGRLLRAADAVTCCSASLRERILKLQICDPDRVIAIHNGIDSGRLQQLVRSEALPAQLRGRRYLLNVGTFEAKKGQDVLVRAFASLHRRYPELLLAIVGRTAPGLPALRDLVKKLGIEEHVSLHVDLPHAEALAFFEQAQVFALSSRDEPFGIVLLEAAHFGVPIVATRVGGVLEVVQDGVSALLVPSEDPVALEQALVRLLEDPVLCQRLVHAAGARTRREFTWDAAFERYSEVWLPRCGVS